MSRLDNCNSLLYGLPVSLLSIMQSIQNSAARIVSRKRLHDHISPILNELHWLPVEKRIIFKLLIMAYECNQGVAPQYLLDIVKSYQPTRNLRSSSINLLTPYSPISPILNELHWLPVEKRIIFKLLIMAYECNQGVAPQYLLDIVKSYQPTRNLRSSSINLLTPYSAITKGYGQRAFQYAIPKLWNSLPNHKLN